MGTSIAVLSLLLAGAADYYRPPQLTLMAGFIKDPQHKGFTVAQWAEGIGQNFDARQLVERCRRAGVVEIIWYDKWIDGLVFRPTKTTSYHTKKNFLAELAPECRRARIKLVIYFNTFFDDNPEFAQWACTDQRGRPIPFSTFWPSNMLSMYSPYREKVLEQIRELFVDYDVDGIWLDVPRFPLMTYDRWSREEFRRRYGKEYAGASPEERAAFATASRNGWNKDVAAFVRKLKPSAVVTTNHWADPLSEGPLAAAGLAEPLDLFTAELHTSAIQQRLAPVLAEKSKPAEAGTLISDDWFTPLNSGPLKSSKSSNQMLQELANLFTSGVNMYLAVALGHDGTVHEGTMQHVDLAGEWLRTRRPYLEHVEDVADVGVMLGSADEADRNWPGGAGSYSEDVMKLEMRLRAAGYMVRGYLRCPHSSDWERIAAGTRTLIVPDRVSLTAADAEQVRSFVRGGGKLVSFGRGVSLGKSGAPRAADGIFGVRSGGYLTESGRMTFRVMPDRQGPALDGTMLQLEPASARVLLWAATHEGDMPLFTRNAAGRGAAYAIPAAEGALWEAPALLGSIWKETIGEPSWKMDGAAERYTVRLRKQAGRYLAHVIDNLSSTEGPMQRYRPAYARLGINTERVKFEKAVVEPEGRPLKISTEGGWKTLELYPDPELTIVLQ